ncbi:MexW/MexI family multidrug efflux RND transporter permease subunit [Pseudomonas sp. FW215-R2]|uniref:MexW/MexI family multidrug efflux RND transporter permease subunit n=1 Tax=unclassified Pseudomonas TaxID=196821 RepID=UPI000BC4819A|nr:MULTISPECIES: MexW/MexI family multidrug efflux RND transporter permease subunit [unclassified Pseudomonas]PCR97204.1 multidrug efflux protein [Pseudomonas fluorescens]PMX03361.1 MexW/MexI family multidrug efflux RND transporter permease subunit [Pseudomonas sp. FW215-R2]PMX12759.1 MexW/MexI family multidrug efflux RND transporter permease subunit [Pseudomonas sp. FW215-L1]PMX25017.1 MexW/MexI family multidrug efflux RND transporter permease subunit [Pseudomonas sp. FW215-E1]PNA29263.1 MexW
MNFTDLFLRRPVLAVVVSTLILLFGVRALMNLPIRQYPMLETSTITVTTQYPGASSELMQGFVTQPISQAVASVEGIDYLSSASTQGRSQVTIRMALNSDSIAALTEVMAKVNQIKYRLPKDAYDPVVERTSGGFTSVAYVAFASSNLTIPEMSDYISRVVEPMFAGIEGVAKINIMGEQKLSMRLWLDPQRLAGYGMTGQDVSAAIEGNNFQAAPGQVKGLYVVSNLRVNTDLNSVEDFRDMVLRNDNGHIIRVRDVGTVELNAASTDTSGAMSDVPALFLGLDAAPTGNPLVIVKRVRELLPQIQETLPPGVTVQIPFEVAHFIQSSIDEVSYTLLEALVIVVLVIYLCLGTFRTVLIPLVTIPLSMLGAAMLMQMFGFSLNLLTLLAMVLAIGLVVDDAIVVVENVHRHIEEGKTPFDAALIGAREVAGPVVAMTFTLAAVYAPIGLMGGLTGTLFKEFALTLAGAVVISGIVALTLSPIMSTRLLDAKTSEGFMAVKADRFFQYLSRRYGALLGGSLARRWISLSVALVIFFSLPFLYRSAQTELAPLEDQNILLTAIKAPQHANLNYLEAYAHELYKTFNEIPEGYSNWVANGSDGLSNSVGGINLVDWEKRGRDANTIQPDLQARVNQIEGTSIFVFQMPPLPGSTGGLPVQMVIRSDQDYLALYNVMDQLKKAAQASGLFAVVDSDLDFNNPVVEIQVDRAKANALGIRMQDIGETLNSLIGEKYVNRFSFHGRSYDVIPQSVSADRLTPETLKLYYVKDQKGNPVPLSTLATLSVKVEPNRLTQFNQQNSATFQAIPAPGVTLGDAVGFLQKQSENFPAGFSFDWQSDARQYVQEGNSLAFTFGLALVIIYLVLSVQYESFRDPFIILISVPLSICGALVPLALGMTSMNIYTQIGLITLIGLISKHGILMVAFANELQRQQGMDRVQAIQHAAQVRLRPILMTTAAMVVGLAPLLFASGAGANSRFGLGLVIVVGMLIGTLFTLFILPSVYTLLSSIKQPSHAPEAEPAGVPQPIL